MYITDALKAITNNTARLYGGSEVKLRYYDLINTKPEQEERTEEEIISQIKAKIKGLK